MGNTLGVECSYNHVRLTSIVVKGEMRSNHEEAMNGAIGADARRENFPSSEDTQPQVGQQQQICSHKIDHNCITGEGSRFQCKSEPSTEHGEYLQMQKDIYAYLLTIRHLIVGHVHLLVLYHDKAKNQHLQMVPSKMGTHLEEPFCAYENFLAAQSSGEGGKKTDPVLDEQIGQIYFITIKVSSVGEALAKYPQKTFSRTVINLTGMRSSYIRKQLFKLKKMNNLSYHEEVKCINSALLFLNKYYPGSLYKFVREECSIHGQEENNNGLREKYLSQMGQAHDTYPYLLVSVNRGITYHLVNANKVVTRVGTCFISYKSAVGLFFLITGKLSSIEKICQLAKRGDSKTFDMSVGDIYGTSYGNAGLSSDLTASFFGSAQHIADVKALFGGPQVQGGNAALAAGTDCDSFDSDQVSDCDSDSERHCDYTGTVQKRCPAHVPHGGGLTKRTIQHCRAKHILMVSKKCQSDPGMESKVYSQVGSCRRRTRSERLLFGDKWHRHMCAKTSNYSKCYEQVRRKNVNLANDSVERHAGQIVQSHVKGSNGDAYKRVHTKVVREVEEEEEPNKYECDLSKSLLSIVIFNAAQQAYIHSQLYNVKNVFFSGYLLENATCVELMKVIVNFMYHNVQQLHFCTLSSYMSSFGCALQCLRWEEEPVPCC
ncbi:hypothetical protein AK88_01269 [Plasmodium fragile]|uniref:Pantothenate kinase n=1 Tax=Plasmodium fragile TaxID=5857 RepID=A0A0D9QQA0_PLAFR|nr:uncharacterized protein AK88_01269 [Plasmodium fragile]KJP88977.1 hypothetical protein AK88_01269 [Plasmodium fragile]